MLLYSCSTDVFRSLGVRGLLSQDPVLQSTQVSMQPDCSNHQGYGCKTYPRCIAQQRMRMIALVCLAVRNHCRTARNDSAPPAGQRTIQVVSCVNPWYVETGLSRQYHLPRTRRSA